MSRLDTRLESEGAEFLVLGQLLLQKIVSYKTYKNMPGYDLVAVDPENNTSATIQVKSRWMTGASGFPIKNLDCDFVVVVLLNRGSKNGKKPILEPDYFIFPIEVIKSVHETNSSWSKVRLKNIENLQDYKSNWELIKQFLTENKNL